MKYKEAEQPIQKIILLPNILLTYYFYLAEIVQITIAMVEATPLTTIILVAETLEVIAGSSINMTKENRDNLNRLI